MLYFGLLILPVLYNFLIFFLGRYFGSGNYQEVTSSLAKGQAILFWASLIIAHILFVLTIVKSYSVKETEEQASNESTDLLDQFTG